MENERQEEESTRDLQLTRWWVPAMAAMLIVNFGLVTLAVGRPMSTRPAPTPVAVTRPAPVSLAPQLLVDPPVAPIEHVVITPDVELAPPEPTVSSEPMPVESTPAELTNEPAMPAESTPIVDPPYFDEPATPIPPVVAQGVESQPAEPQPVNPSPAESPAEQPPTEQPAPQPTPAEPMLPIEPAPASEPAPTQPTPVELPRNELPALVIVNPPQSGGPVHLAIDGIVITLLPGEYHRVNGKESRRVEYHRGDDFDYAQHELAEGTHQFQVGDTGWTLVLVEPAKATRLIETCRPIAK